MSEPGRIEHKDESADTQTERRIKTLDVLNRIGVAALGILDTELLCETVANLMAEIFRVGTLFISFYSPESGMIETPVFLSDGKRIDAPAFKYGQGLASIVIREKRPLIIQKNTEAESARLGAILLCDRIPKSWIGVPIIENGEAIGLISVQEFDHEDFFTEDDISLLGTIAFDLAGAMRNASLYREAKRKTAEMEALLEIGRKLTMTLDLDAALTIIVNQAQELLTKDTTAVYLLEDRTDILIPVTGTGRDIKQVISFKVPMGSGIIGHAAATGKSEIVNDTYSDERGIHIDGSSNESPNEKLMAVPLRVREKIIGMMAVWRSPSEPAFAANELELCEGLSRYAAIAIENARLYGQAKVARADAEEANRMKSRFLATMSHELRTPLNAIINFAYLLQEEKEGLSLDQLDLLGRIETSGNQLLALINDVLDLSKIEAGKIDLTIEEVDIQSFLGEIESIVKGLAQKKDLRVSFSHAKSLPSIPADRLRLRQILLNLVSNAIKFTEKGSVNVEAALEGNSVVFRVRDTGIGMYYEDIESAFSEFSQLDHSGNRQAGGTGLGLPIARKLAEMHGGTILAKSNPGQGSVFEVRLPVRHPGKHSA